MKSIINNNILKYINLIIDDTEIEFVFKQINFNNFITILEKLSEKNLNQSTCLIQKLFTENFIIATPIKSYCSNKLLDTVIY